MNTTPTAWSGVPSARQKGIEGSSTVDRPIRERERRAIAHRRGTAAQRRARSRIVGTMSSCAAGVSTTPAAIDGPAMMSGTAIVD